jgi:biopolymer transport protein ExbD
VNLRPRRRAQADINLTPLIDVVFLLLIFFMVSTTFRDEARLRVQLPQAQGEPVAAEEPEMIRILIDRLGSFHVNDQVVADRETGTLARALEGALGDRAGLPVLIQADARTPHQAVMRALDAASRAGLVHIAFAATLSEGPVEGSVEQSAGGSSQ